MSGGAFDYAYFNVEQFADELEFKIKNRHIENVYGELPYQFSDEVIEKLLKIIPITRKTSKLMKEVEWLYSGDNGEDSFLRNINRISID